MVGKAAGQTWKTQTYSVVDLGMSGRNREIHMRETQGDQERHMTETQGDQERHMTETQGDQERHMREAHEEKRQTWPVKQRLLDNLSWIVVIYVSFLTDK